MSDVEEEFEGFDDTAIEKLEDEGEAKQQPRARSPLQDEPPSKRRKIQEEEVKEPEKVFLMADQTTALEDYDTNLYVKTQNVKDFGNVLGGCCSIPGVSHVIMTFDPSGMQLYAKPNDSPTAVTVFFSREMFTEYKVTKETRRMLDKARLDSMKKKINKEVEFLEIRSWAETPGFTFSGYRCYKTGGKCQFTFNIADVVHSMNIYDMTSLKWNYVIRTSSQKFKDNIDFIDDSNEFIRMSIKDCSLEFCGIRDNGQIGEIVNQEIENKFTETFEALFQKKYLKIITASKDLNKSLTIAFNLDDPDNPEVLPVHFSYELDMEKNQSKFSCFIVPYVCDM